MSKKIRVGILFGGKSAEHEISLLSAKNIIEAIDSKKYEAVLIGIDKKGQWRLYDEKRYLAHENDPMKVRLFKAQDDLAVVPGKGLMAVKSGKALEKLDVIFPVLHGTFGEDGTVQGLLKLADLPFVGASVLGSAVAMDKDVMKRLLRDAGLPIPNFLSFTDPRDKELTFAKARRALGTPVFVKPANMGSSVGISKAKNKKEFDHAVRIAFEFDRKIIIEEFIEGREIECAVLGNENPVASVCGEIIPTHEFYSYDAKYLDDNGAIFKIPAPLAEPLEKRIRKLAIDAFKVLECEGLARVDFFLKGKKPYLNEINTMPGFTRISMYPKLFEASGLPCPKLIDKLIKLALERHSKEKKLKTRYS